MVEVLLWDFAIATATARRSPGAQPILDPTSRTQISALYISWPETRYLLLANYLPQSLKDPSDKEMYRKDLWQAAQLTSLRRSQRHHQEVNRTIAVLEAILDLDAEQEEPEKVRSAFLSPYENKVTDYRAQYLRKHHLPTYAEATAPLEPLPAPPPLEPELAQPESSNRPMEHQLLEANPEVLEDSEVGTDAENLDTDSSNDTELDLATYGPESLPQYGQPHQPPIVTYPREHYPVLAPATGETYRQCRDRARARISWLKVELDDLDPGTLRSDNYRHQLRVLKLALRNSRNLIRHEKLRVATT